MASSDQDLAIIQQHRRQLVAVLPAGPGAGDMPTFEEIPISPRARERPLGVDYETQLPGSNRHVIHRAAVTSSAFGENVDRLGSIRSILDNYPFSAGLLREILQNSDDAEATVQTFLLDCRMHPSERICHPSIASTQGPALLAFNNAKFSEKDWIALQNISRSSKREDTSKIGKFGIGIRSCYHVTDFLQILSGEDLVIFDPQSSFSDGGGSRFLVNPETIEPIRDHLQAFGYFLPLDWDGETFDGTVIRLPLRTEPGKIREKTVSPQEIRQLFREFIEKELSIAMLFLQHLQSIEFTIIDEEGRVTKMAYCTVELVGRLSGGAYKQTVRLQNAEEASDRDEEWLVVHASFPNGDVLKLLSAQAGSPCEKVLEKHKLSADVGLAFLLNSTRNIEPDIGQLFTFLRLPIKTGFPAHIHSLFSLTPSRQNLRPHGENGIVPGSDDYILIEWNKLLFDVFIPRAWSNLLETIAIHFPTTPIFSAWPVAKHFTESDSAYWASFPENVLDTVLANDVAVWPVIGQDVYKQLQDVFVARPSTSEEVIQALAGLGMSVCRPPEHLFRMIEALPNWEHRILTPERTSDMLRVIFASNPFDAPAERRTVILQYLLSSNNIRNIVGLSVIPTVSGSFVSLSQQDATPKICTLLETADVEVFKLCDENAISLDDIPPSAVRLFREQASHFLNVKWLNPDQVVRYLGLHPTRRGLQLSQDEADSSAVTFLSKFWTWLDGWDHRSLLLAKLESEPVLPCVGGLRRALRSQPVFDAIGIDPALSACLSGLGVPFLSSTLDPEARDILARYGFLKSATEMHALLDAVTTVGGSMSDQDAQLLFDHFNRYMVNSTWYSFSEGQKTAFRKLPIFPIVEYDINVSQRRRRTAVQRFSVYGLQSFELLPVLPNTVFVDVNVNALDHRLLPLLNESEHRFLSDMEVLDLCVNRLDQQPKKLLARMLQHIANATHRDGLTSLLLQSLRSEKYAYSLQGTREAPQTLIDPSSPLYSLYANDNQRLHSLKDAEERSIADSLSRLGLLDKALSAHNITDRIGYIASTASFEDAVELLNIIYEHGFNCHSLTLDESAQWLPTQNGTLATAAECRPGKGSTSEEHHLFDKILQLVHSRAALSPSLRTVLGWDDPVPMDVLFRQFGQVLDHPDDDVYHRVKNLIKELSNRQLSLTTSQWSSVRLLLEDRRWVPTSEYTLVESWQAVFSSSFQGIYTVAPDLSKIGSESCKFLTKLDCLPTPSFATVARRLSQLAAETPSATVTSSVIATLKSAVSLPLTEGQRSQLLVPDDLGRLQPIQDVLFNDVGEHSRLLSRDEVCLASSSIDDDLAKDLGLQRLGLKHVHLQTLGEDMGVTPATLVEKTLAQYTDKQFLVEFLANAQDAGASKLLIVLNEYASVEGNFLSSDLQRLYDGPSVMVYNDSEFSDPDFKGICSTHIGGKAGNPDSIGQFGLGALTMFHITECAVIYSGDKVLFLDPSKSYLPIVGRASLLMPLKDLDRVYPGHTGYLKGLEFFDPQACRVNGTIFFLPLRSSSLALQGRRPLFPTIYSIDTFQQTILRDFHEKAGECLLFIKINEVEAQLRTAAQSTTVLWSLTACRTETAFDGFIEKKLWIDSCACSSKKTSSEWLTMSAIIEAPAIPQEYKAGAGSKTLRVGLAAPIGDTHKPQSKFFSMLPLAIPTTLPVHVNASFRLSSDRRQIRLDDYDNDTLFNRWVLETQLPPLYLALLERIAQERNNNRWWPGTLEDVHPPTDLDEDDSVMIHEDVPTAIMLKAFYSKHLPKSLRNIFYSMYSNESFRKSDAILYSTRPKTPTASPASIPSSVERIIETLRPKCVIKPIKSVTAHLEKVESLKVLGPPFIGQLLLKGGGETIRGGLSKEDLAKLLDWLAGEKRTDLLKGLPLLILQDETWRVFETEGQIFYGSPQSQLFVKRGLFPADRFVHPDAISERLLKILSSSVFRIAELDAAGLRKLVEERLDGLDEPTRAPWVDLFWRMYPELPKTDLLTSIETLPLVPKMSGTSFKSLIECRESGLINDDASSEGLVGYFQDLGIDVIPIKRFPPDLQDVLQSRDYNLRGSLFTRFLRCVSPIIETAIDKMKNWSPDRQSDFATWVRERVWRCSHTDYSVVRKLPVWLARRGSETSLCPANEVRLLPRGISIDAGRFSRSFMTEDTRVRSLDIPMQTLPQLYHALTFPPSLEEGDDERIYKDLLTSFLRLTTHDIPSIPVPNASRVMVHCNTLVDRNTLFMAAFGSSSTLFLLPSFTSFTSRLKTWGLRLALDLDLFVLCAQAIHDDDRPDSEKLDRARIVYQAYCDSLPVYLPSNEQWKSLDDIRFIPRDIHESRKIGSQEVELPGSIRGLPLLVSPRQVVQRRFHSICWTQRTVLQEEPHARILVAFGEFGSPSVEEVVKHLKELSASPHRRTILPDLKATYEWLNQQETSELQSLGLSLHDDPIFLNVNDPEKDDWNWSSASRMAFEVEGLTNIQGVRKFLRNYRTFLAAAGVLEAHYPEADEDGEDSGSPHDLKSLQSLVQSFNEQRLGGKFTDVLFLPHKEASGRTREQLYGLDDPSLRGHQIVLAGCATWFKNLFLGGSLEGVGRSADGIVSIAGDDSGDLDGDGEGFPVERSVEGEKDTARERSPNVGQALSDTVLVVLLPKSRIAIRAVLDHFYTGRPFPQEAEVTLEDLLQTLELASYLGVQSLSVLSQGEIIRRKLVNPETLQEVRRRTQRLDANIVNKWCDDFEKANPKLFELVSRHALAMD